jgi:hypothetical protein
MKLLTIQEKLQENLIMSHKIIGQPLCDFVFPLRNFG